MAGTITSIKNLMDTMSWTIEQATMTLKISEEARQRGWDKAKGEIPSLCFCQMNRRIFSCGIRQKSEERLPF